MSDRYQIWNQDCIAGMAERLKPDSVHLCITSIPFGALFQYSGKTEDIGNNVDGVDMRASQFGLHMRFAIEQLFRVMEPGGIVAIHIQQLITTKVQHGHMGRRDLRGATVDLFGAGGFDWTGEITIPKNPQAMAQRMKLHSLLFITGKRDARALAPAMNDYILVFRRPGEGTPVPALYDPEINPGGWVTTDEWVRDACGFWADIRETDVLTGWRDAREEDDEKHVCLARGSLVVTRDGHIPIEDVEVGQLVLTHCGRWRPVLAKACNGMRPIIRTTAQGVADLQTTPDHPILTRSGARSGRWPGDKPGKRVSRKAAQSATPRWQRADETIGNYVSLPLPPVEPSPLSADDWWIVGRWLGDGHMSTRGLPYLSCSHEEAYGLKDRLGAHAGNARRTGTATQMYIKDRNGKVGGPIHDMIRRCGSGAGGKRVPAEALALEPDKAEALLSGYLSADGHYVPAYDRWTASSVSRALVLGMAMVAQRARGVVASVYAGRPAGGYTIQGRTVQTRQDWVMAFRNSPGYRQSGWISDDGAWKKVRSIAEAGEAEVWDLQVAEDQSFVAEGCVVHNCPLQLTVIRRLVRLYSNPDALVLDPFMGIGSVGVVALECGRRAVGFELKESYWDQAVRNCERELQRQRAERALPLFDLAGVAVAD